jgi:hypothetical protein
VRLFQHREDEEELDACYSVRELWLAVEAWATSSGVVDDWFFLVSLVRMPTKAALYDKVVMAACTCVVAIFEVLMKQLTDHPYIL